LNQIAGALKIPAKAIFLDHRFSRWFFFWKSFSSKNRVFNHIVHPTFSRSTKKEKMSNTKYQVNNCSISIKLILFLLTRVVYRSFNCSFLLLKVMSRLRDEKV